MILRFREYGTVDLTHVPALHFQVCDASSFASSSFRVDGKYCYRKEPYIFNLCPLIFWAHVAHSSFVCHLKQVTLHCPSPPYHAQTAHTHVCMAAWGFHLCWWHINQHLLHKRQSESWIQWRWNLASTPLPQRWWIHEQVLSWPHKIAQGRLPGYPTRGQCWWYLMQMNCKTNLQYGLS